MSGYDYAVVIFYLGFMFAMGPIYKSFSKNSSDFFRGGGGMLWWVVGSSAFMTNFSAWSFTGGAAKAYETGTFFLVLFLCNFLSNVFCYFFTAARFRQMRVITAIEAVHKRFGGVTEQVYTWLTLPTRGLTGGIMLYVIAVFMSGVFEVDMNYVIIILGIVVTLMTLLGGSWAATAGDFVQMLMVVVITVVMAILTIYHPAIGGVGGLIDKIPARHLNWTLFDRPGIIVFFVITLMINQLTLANSIMTGAARYVFVKDGKDAKKAVLVPVFGFLLLSGIWMIPAIGAAIIFPNLETMFPQLNNPNEAAYVAIATEMLPDGLVGLLVCGIFAASMTTMNSTLNILSGTYVRNFHIKIINKEASEKSQVFIGRLVILIFGMIWILIGLYFQSMKEVELFDLILMMAASISLPSMLPLTFSIFIKRTPVWTGWSTTVIGFAMSILLRILFTIDKGNDFVWLRGLWSSGEPLTKREIGDLNIAITTAVLFTVCAGWFLFSMLFYKKSKKEYVDRVEEFFTEMDTPINRAVEHEPDYESDSRQYGVLGNLCAVYGAFIMILVLVPNVFSDRMLFVYSGGFMFVVGVILKKIARRIANKNAIQN